MSRVADQYGGLVHRLHAQIEQGVMKVKLRAGAACGRFGGTYHGNMFACQRVVMPRMDHLFQGVVQQVEKPVQILGHREEHGIGIAHTAFEFCHACGWACT